jgi:hypothetical protein
MHTIPDPDPATLQADFGEKPELWERIAAKKISLKSSEKLFPDYVAMPASIVQSVIEDFKKRPIAPDETSQPLMYAGTFAWKLTQGRYRFDPDLERELFMEARKDFSVSNSLLYQLPAKCVAISVNGVLPTLVYFDYDIDTRQPKLCFMLMSRGGTRAFALPIVGATIEDTLAQAQVANVPLKVFEPLMPHVLHLCGLKLDHSEKQETPKSYLVTRDGAIAC